MAAFSFFALDPENRMIFPAFETFGMIGRRFEIISRREIIRRRAK